MFYKNDYLYVASLWPGDEIVIEYSTLLYERNTGRYILVPDSMINEHFMLNDDNYMNMDPSFNPVRLYLESTLTKYIETLSDRQLYNLLIDQEIDVHDNIWNCEDELLNCLPSGSDECYECFRERVKNLYSR